MASYTGFEQFLHGTVDDLHGESIGIGKNGTKGRRPELHRMKKDVLRNVS
jgi:hypothetical protein